MKNSHFCQFQGYCRRFGGYLVFIHKDAERMKVACMLKHARIPNKEIWSRQIRKSKNLTPVLCSDIHTSMSTHVVHYLHLLSTQISAGECCSKFYIPWCTYWKLRSRQLPRLVTRQKHHALNGQQKTSTTLLFNNYNPTSARFGSCRCCRLGSHLKKCFQAECLCLASTT